MKAAQNSSNTSLELIGLLREELATAQSRNPSYSLRALAKRLRVAPAELSLLMRGKRRLTQAMASRLLLGLAHEPSETQRLLAGIPQELSRTRRKSVRSVAAPELVNYIQLSTDEFRVVADWYIMAILALSETASFRPRPDWIARRLRINTQQARSAVEILTRLGLLQDGKPTGKRFTTTNDIPDASLRKNHAQGLALASRALEEVPVELREFGASIIAVDPSKLPEAKTRLREMRREVSRLLESGERTEVYRLSVQLIPLTTLRRTR